MPPSLLGGSLLGRSFEGTKHFVGQHEAFLTAREWLVPMLEACSGKPRDEMLAVVKAAQVQLGCSPLS